MNYKISDTVQYEIWDGEEGRSYGWFLNKKTAKIVSVFYKLDNGDMIEEKKLVLVRPVGPSHPTNPTQTTQSKSETQTNQ